MLQEKNSGTVIEIPSIDPSAGCVKTNSNSNYSFHWINVFLMKRVLHHHTTRNKSLQIKRALVSHRQALIYRRASKLAVDAQNHT